MTERQWIRLAELCGMALSQYLPDSDEYHHMRWTQSYARTNALTLQFKSKRRTTKPLTTQHDVSNLPAMSEHQTQSGEENTISLPPPPHLWSTLPHPEPTPENQIAYAVQERPDETEEPEPGPDPAPSEPEPHPQTHEEGQAEPPEVQELG